MKLLSRQCIGCGRDHAIEDMQDYVNRCQERGRDPLAAPKGGFLCPKCHLEAIFRLCADEEPDE